MNHNSPPPFCIPNNALKGSQHSTFFHVEYINSYAQAIGGAKTEFLWLFHCLEKKKTYDAYLLL